MTGEVCPAGLALRGLQLDGSHAELPAGFAASIAPDNPPTV